ncbi:MAG: small multi-drug export protein [Clostridia bacterium]|nr:small multi-drug export protein [Clostridia bacterium]
MTELIHNVFASIFGNNVALATILISMIPIIEIRGAIPFATNSGFWLNNSLSNWAAFGWGLLGSSAIVPIIALLFFPVMKWLKRTRLFGKLANGIENRIKGKAANIEGSEEKSKRFSKPYWKKILAVLIFVAVPLPLTGVWTGTCIAVFIGLDYISTCITVILGNVIAGFLITLILELFPWLNDWLFYIFIVLIIIVVAYELIRHFINKKKNTEQKQ